METSLSELHSPGEPWLMPWSPCTIPSLITSHVDCFNLCRLSHLVMVKYTAKGALSAFYQGMGKDEVAPMRRTI